MPTGSLQRLPMSYDEWLRLPDKPKAEWVDGVAVVSPPAGFRHQHIGGALLLALRAGLPDLKVVYEVGVQLSGNRVRIPDLVAVVDAPSGDLVQDAPVLVVEILSPSTRQEDLMSKGPEYSAAGISQYWVVDPEARALTVYRLASPDEPGHWAEVIEFDDEHPTGSVVVGDHGTVEIDVAALLAD